MHVLSGNTLATIAQGLQFFLLARALGPTEFGQVGTASAVVVLLLPYSGMGAANVMIMRATRDTAVLPLYFGNALLVMFATGALLTGFSALVVAPLVGSGFDPWFMLIFGASELLAGKIVDICWQVFVARDEMRQVSVVFAVQSISRLVMAGLYAVISAHPSARGWGYCALACNFVVGLGILYWTRNLVGALRFDPKLAVRELPPGAAFAVGLSAKGFYTDADKVFLARFTDPATVATYTMAYRVVSVALVPARALSFSLTAQMFRAGESGVTGALAMTRRLFLPTLALGLVLALGCYITAPLLPLIGGEKYASSIEILRILALLPVVVSMQSLLADTLSSSGYQAAAAICQAIAGFAIVGLSIALIPALCWRGAGLASYASQILLSILLAFVIVRSGRRERRTSTTSAPVARESEERATPPALLSETPQSLAD
jgi:O-antigen/teichoic acid export membrane protein